MHNFSSFNPEIKPNYSYDKNNNELNFFSKLDKFIYFIKIY